jgi:hypothetical protein
MARALFLAERMVASHICAKLSAPSWVCARGLNSRVGCSKDRRPEQGSSAAEQLTPAAPASAQVPSW